MNIQIYGKAKCFDTKKAERYFKERGIKYQSIDLPRFGMSAGEFASVKKAVGGVAALCDTEGKSPMPRCSTILPATRRGRKSCSRTPACCAPDCAQRQAGHGGLLPRGVERRGNDHPSAAAGF
jgi:hypothetical protein